MNQRLLDWANMAQVVSGLAVVVTLVFLIFEVRDSTNATRAASFQDLMTDLNQFNLAIIDDGGLARVWVNRSHLDVASLDEEESSRLILLYRTMYRTYDAAYYSWVFGSLADEQWTRFMAPICANINFLDAEWVRIEGVVSDEFRAYIQNNCSR